MFLSVLPSKQHHIIARDIDALDRNNRTISIRKTREDYPKVFTIKIGAKVMLLRNMRVKKDWVNGTIGTITRIGNNAIEIEKLRIKNPAIFLNPGESGGLPLSKTFQNFDQLNQ
jgi:hypothetical protein